MNRILSIVAVCLLFVIQTNWAEEPIRLLVRGDDMGAAHSVNVACIEAYKNGISRSVEVIAVGPWFLEAAELLRENPGLDVGLHLALTSEWSHLKWRPISNVPSLVDSNGYFHSMVWPNENFGENESLKGSQWQIEEVERELGAQIELALSHIPHISHLSTHMGFSNLDPSIAEVVERLRVEYGLGKPALQFQRFWGWGKVYTFDQRLQEFADKLANMDSGTYLFVDHPAYDTPEMRAVYHKGYENVAVDRDLVTKVWTNQKIKNIIRERGIELISYKDLIK